MMPSTEDFSTQGCSVRQNALLQPHTIQSDYSPKGGVIILATAVLSRLGALVDRPRLVLAR